MTKPDSQLARVKLLVTQLHSERDPQHAEAQGYEYHRMVRFIRDVSLIVELPYVKPRKYLKQLS